MFVLAFERRQVWSASLSDSCRAPVCLCLCMCRYSRPNDAWLIPKKYQWTKSKTIIQQRCF